MYRSLHLLQGHTGTGGDNDLNNSLNHPNITVDVVIPLEIH